MNLSPRHALTTLAMLGALTFGAQDAQAFEFVESCTATTGYTWANNRLPLPYYVNNAGSDDLPFARVLEIFASSFSQWEQPCCSNFRSSYEGTTTRTAINNGFNVVLSFFEQDWPRELGDANGGVIAVTLLRFGRSCTIIDAPIAFNGVGVRFTDQCNATGCAQGRTDLEGVATHEIGHLLGLDHSPLQSATMFYAYTGGNGARSLHQDDQAGVCALYPRVCSCTQDSDCLGEREQCVQGACEFVPCTHDNQCDAGLVCRGGDCVVPPCTDDASCGPGFVCDPSGKCLSTCPVCRPCDGSPGQCGAQGSCVDFNGDGAGECITFCSQDGTCPGDSLCYELPAQGQTYFLCLNPNVNSVGVCPPQYVCMAPQDPCEAVNCPEGQLCRGGRCEAPPDPCDGIRCAVGKVCEAGECVEGPDLCEGVTCATGQVCQQGSCVTPVDPCEDVTCALGQVCQGGTCVAPGALPVNPDDEVIILTPTTSQSEGCGCASTSATPHGAAPLALLLLGALSLRRKRRR